MGEAEWKAVNGYRPKDSRDSAEYPLKETIKFFLSNYFTSKTEAERDAAKEKFKKEIEDCKNKTSIVAAMKEVQDNLNVMKFMYNELDNLLLDNKFDPMPNLGEKYAVKDEEKLIIRMKQKALEEENEASKTSYLDEAGRFTDKKPKNY